MYKFPRLSSVVRVRMLVNYEYVTLTTNNEYIYEYGTMLRCVPVLLDLFTFKTFPKECFAKCAAAREMDKEAERMGNQR